MEPEQPEPQPPAPLDWCYHGPITVVVIDDDTEFHGRGRLAARTDEPGGWHAEVTRLPEQAMHMTGMPHREVMVSLPGGGDAPGYGVMPVMAVAGRGAGLYWLIDGDDPMPDLPPRDSLTQLRDWLRWQWDLTASYRRLPRFPRRRSE